MSETPTLDLSQAVDLSALMYKKAEEKAKQLPRDYCCTETLSVGGNGRNVCQQPSHVKDAQRYRA